MIIPDKHTRAAMKNLRRMDEYTWHRRMSFKPRVSNWSGDRIPMFTYAYRGTRIIQGPGDDLLVIRWMSPNSYLIEKIKGTL